jgi:hypothetical protein
VDPRRLLVGDTLDRFCNKQWTSRANDVGSSSLNPPVKCRYVTLASIGQVSHHQKVTTYLADLTWLVVHATVKHMGIDKNGNENEALGQTL